jgi:hypothetical protein
MDPHMMDGYGHRMMGDHGWMGDHWMTGGHGMYPTMSWAPVGLLLGMLLLIGIAWLVMLWLNYQNHVPVMSYSARPKDSYQSYEQGYRPRQPLPETYQESEREYHSIQQEHTQPQIELEYPQQVMPWQQ